MSGTTHAATHPLLAAFLLAEFWWVWGRISAFRNHANLRAVENKCDLQCSRMIFRARIHVVVYYGSIASLLSLPVTGL